MGRRGNELHPQARSSRSCGCRGAYWLLNLCGTTVFDCSSQCRGPSHIQGASGQCRTVYGGKARSNGDNLSGRRADQDADGESFEEYIRKAFIADLDIAEVYSAAAPVTLTGRLDAIDFSSGLTDAAWDIALTISSSNGKSLSVDNHYSFAGNFVGEVACNQTAQALMPAVQDLIGKMITHPDFAALLR